MMLFQTISALSLLLSSAVAAPRSAPAMFDVMALRSGSAIQFAQVSAAKSGLFLNMPQSNATCDSVSSGHATFHIENEELFLYSVSGEQQKVFVDRSGMGQGVIQYVTGAQPAPKNAELQGWAIDANDNLVFAGNSFLACPDSIDGAWSIWLAMGSDQPAGNQGCLGFTARVLDNIKPVGCEYTQ